MLKIAILNTQVPFVTGGAELLAVELKNTLEAANLGSKRIVAEIVTIPFVPEPPLELINQIALWRLTNLSSFDVVIPLKFPAYYVNHPRIRPWILHQHRQAYDLYNTRFSNLHLSHDGANVAKMIRALDTECLKNLPRKAISQTVAKRLWDFNGLESDVIYAPPPNSNLYQKSHTFEAFLLAPGRIDYMKRQDLLIRALKHVPFLRVVFIGDGQQQEEFQKLSYSLGVDDRITWRGLVSIEEKLQLYQKCLAVYYAPFQEDYGFITLEAFLSGKPVLTTNDAGGVLEFVQSNINGLVAEPNEDSIGASLKLLLDGGPSFWKRLGDAGTALVNDIGLSWSQVKKEFLTE